MAAPVQDPEENRRRMEAGELYYAFTPELIADRRRCKQAYQRFNKAEDVSRRELVELYKDIINDKTPLPVKGSTTSDEEDEAALEDYPWIDGPIKMDYGYNVKLGSNVYVNCNSTWIDTSAITIGSRTLIGPDCSFYSGSHPLDPTIRNGTRGPETGKPISVGEDCWFGGNCTVVPGVAIGKGCTIGAGSVVTKSFPDYVCIVGNPARILKKIDVSDTKKPDEGAEVLAGESVVKA